MPVSKYKNKSTVAQIQERFDADVERFSNLETGQTSTVDAALAMELITTAAVSTTASIRRVLDIGCGAGNNSLRLLQLAGPFDCDLLDLSAPMLSRAQARINASNVGQVRIFHGDFRNIELVADHYDVIIAAAVLHHLRDDDDWHYAFEKIYTLTAPGGSVWISDLVSHETEGVEAMMWRRYGDYLTEFGGGEYKTKVFDYIDKEDSPRPVTFQLDLLRSVGFEQIELLHKNSCFAAYGAVKAA
ncbi:MAG: class I SAM-dependent methyltransferase [Gammaproteobacteria bacterium]|nr:MAG: class I SAM-dependent methyltransferase [Gammaproteobacteria bacterium]RLA53459.1 MAG: class I SAM-dependent methyltransferase [Gammaproteobacteria bacterium]